VLGLSHREEKGPLFVSNKIEGIYLIILKKYFCPNEK
jgi:hypothetical protein